MRQPIYQDRPPAQTAELHPSSVLIAAPFRPMTASPAPSERWSWPPIPHRIDGHGASQAIRMIERDMPDFDRLVRAKWPEHLPEVLSTAEVAALLSELAPPFHLMGELLYGTGLSLMECVSLRVKDIDFERRQVIVRRGKGNHDRVALLPLRATEELRSQIHVVDCLHQHDREHGLGEVETGTDIRTIQTLLGHQDLRTTMIYTHVLDREPLGVTSPLDRHAFTVPRSNPHVASIITQNPPPQAQNRRPGGDAWEVMPDVPGTSVRLSACASSDLGDIDAGGAGGPLFVFVLSILGLGGSSDPATAGRSPRHSVA